MKKNMLPASKLASVKPLMGFVHGEFSLKVFRKCLHKMCTATCTETQVNNQFTATTGNFTDSISVVQVCEKREGSSFTVPFTLVVNARCCHLNQVVTFDC